MNQKSKQYTRANVKQYPAVSRATQDQLEDYARSEFRSYVDVGGISAMWQEVVLFSVAVETGGECNDQVPRSSQFTIHTTSIRFWYFSWPFTNCYYLMDVLVCESHDGEPQQIVGILVELQQSNRRRVARVVEGCARSRTWLLPCRFGRVL